MNETLKTIKARRSIRKFAKEPVKAEDLQAPINIIISGDDQDLWSRPNCAAAVQNILLAAESLGLGACWKNMITGLLNSEEGQALKERLGIPAGYRPYFGVVLGYKIEDNNPIPPRKTDCINYV